ncbi:unnamed protein product [Brassica rapa subsp. trilocularis]
MIPHYSWFGAMKVYQLVNLESISVSQAELRQRFMQLPKYLRVAIRHCILRKDASLSSDGTLMQLYILATVGPRASSWCIAQTTLVQGLYKHQQNICYNHKM